MSRSSFIICLFIITVLLHYGQTQTIDTSSKSINEFQTISHVSSIINTSTVLSGLGIAAKYQLGNGNKAESNTTAATFSPDDLNNLSEMLNQILTNLNNTKPIQGPTVETNTSQIINKPKTQTPKQKSSNPPSQTEKTYSQPQQSPKIDSSKTEIQAPKNKPANQIQSTDIKDTTSTSQPTTLTTQSNSSSVNTNQPQTSNNDSSITITDKVQTKEPITNPVENSDPLFAYDDKLTQNSSANNYLTQLFQPQGSNYDPTKYFTDATPQDRGQTNQTDAKTILNTTQNSEIPKDNLATNKPSSVQVQTPKSTIQSNQSRKQTNDRRGNDQAAQTDQSDQESNVTKKQVSSQTKTRNSEYGFCQTDADCILNYGIYIGDEIKIVCNIEEGTCNLQE